MSRSSNRTVEQSSEGPLVPPSIRAGEFVFVSGQASVDENGNVVPGTFAEQMHRSIENVRSILADNGLMLSDVVKVGAYVRDPANRAEYNQLYSRYFDHPRPARTTTVNCLPEHIEFEIDVVATTHRRE